MNRWFNASTLLAFSSSSYAANKWSALSHALQHAINRASVALKDSKTHHFGVRQEYRIGWTLLEALDLNDRQQTQRVLRDINGKLFFFFLIDSYCKPNSQDKMLIDYHDTRSTQPISIRILSVPLSQIKAIDLILFYSSAK